MTATGHEMTDVILKRRSVRRFDPGRQVSREDWWKVLEAAVRAPSAHNSQPWRFIVLENPKSKRLLIDTLSESFITDLQAEGVAQARIKELVAASRERLSGAPVLILAAMKEVPPPKKVAIVREIHEAVMATQSLAAAVENLLVAATALGLGSCWVSAPLYCQDQIRKAFGLDETLHPQALIMLGHPAPAADPTKRFQAPVEASVEFR